MYVHPGKKEMLQRLVCLTGGMDLPLVTFKKSCRFHIVHFNHHLNKITNIRINKSNHSSPTLVIDLT